MSQQYALNGRQESFKYTLRVAAITFITGAFFSMLSYGIFSVLIDKAYPNYSNSKTLLPYFFIIISFRISDFWSSFLIVTRQDQKLFFIMLFTTSFIIAMWAVTKEFNFQILTIKDVGALALFVTVANYIMSALFAWKSSKSVSRIDILTSG